MRIASWVAIAVLCGAMIGCGGESDAPRPPPAGRQPLPSSEPPRAAPASGGRTAPMFAGAPSGNRFAQLSRTPLIREERARMEAEERARGPIRIGGEDARGRARGQALIAAAQEAPADADPCQQAWRAQEVIREEAHASTDGEAEREFLRACRAMPEGDRNCMSPTYLRDHAEECERIQQETLERLQRQRHVARSLADLR